MPYRTLPFLSTPTTNNTHFFLGIGLGVACALFQTKGVGKGRFEQSFVNKLIVANFKCTVKNSHQVYNRFCVGHGVQPILI